jgi:carboxyl-terminal processing protease
MALKRSKRLKDTKPKLQINLLAATGVLFSAMLLQACGPRQSNSLATLTPTTYLTNVLGIIRAQAMKSGDVDWKAVRTKSFQLAAGAKTTADTYPAINYALSQLGDQHSFLVDRNGAPTLARGDAKKQFMQINRVAPSDVIEVGDKKIGFIVIGSFAGERESPAAQNYAKALKDKLGQIAQQHPAGWIVDLRGNGGGNMWPMIGGVGPLMGSGTLGYFIYSRVSIPWYYSNGEAGTVNALGWKDVAFKIKSGGSDTSFSAPVAVLLDGSTASSGEAVAISFKGRPDTRFFGQHSCGLSTSNESIKLADGAMLYLTTSTEADRNRTVYNSGITPDVTVQDNNLPSGDKDDPTIRASLQWLSEK